MSQEKLNQILDEHAKWVRAFGNAGSRADLHRADLRGADLHHTDLSGALLVDADLGRADLVDADLHRADLHRADLHRADLRGADLSGALLVGADLHRADLRGANLSGADLHLADLHRADLRGADLSGADLPPYGIPEQGDIIAWKAVKNGIARVRIPADAKRTGSLVDRKCRAEYVITEEIVKTDGSEVHEAYGQRGEVVYRVGEATYPDRYDDDPRIVCTHGIHFFLTRGEAEGWV